MSKRTRVVRLTDDGWAVALTNGKRETHGTQARAVEAAIVDGANHVVLIGIDGEELGQVAGSMSDDDRSRLASSRLSVEELGKLRARLMVALYELTRGRDHEIVMTRELIEQAGLSRYANDVVEASLQYLEGENLIESFGDVGSYSITHRGRVEVERRLLTPGQPTDHFPPAAPTTIYNIGFVAGRQIQFGGEANRQVLVNDYEPLLEWLQLLRAQITEIQLSDAERADLLSAANTIETELKKPQPSRAVVDRMRGLVRDLLVSAGGSLSVELIARLDALPL